jgi:hypothetical protein
LSLLPSTSSTAEIEHCSGSGLLRKITFYSPREFTLLQARLGKRDLSQPGAAQAMKKPLLAKRFARFCALVNETTL